jgi:starch synthase
MRRALASADLLVVPARHDPSGVRAMLALRYGAVPIAHATGGLADVVRDVADDPAAGNGFAFRGYQQVELLRTVRRAERARADGPFWAGLVRRGMLEERPWSRAAASYAAVYAKAREDAR